MKRVVLIGLFFVCALGTTAQEEEESKSWSIHGYMKDMVTVIGGDETLLDNLVHNRLNFEWFPSDQWTIKIGMRNRIFSGDIVKSIPNYAQFIDTNNDYLNMSVIWASRDNLVIHSVFDRAYVEWNNGTWEIRAGRQRINWGTNVVWNPNDIFNAYSFFDFDYEERPGSDAIRIVRYIGFASSLEIAVTAADHIDKSVAAAMWKFNRGQYDIQLISGIAKGDYVLGTGWAGNLGKAGFKGELSYFTPYNESTGRTDGFTGSLGIDYSLKNGLYLLGSYLYNSGGTKDFDLQNNFLFSNQELSARNLMPLKHSFVANISYPITPLINGGVAFMAFPGTNVVFANPSVGVSITQTLDLGLFGQILYGDKTPDQYGAISKAGFLRLKYSF